MHVVCVCVCMSECMYVVCICMSECMYVVCVCLRVRAFDMGVGLSV